LDIGHDALRSRRGLGVKEGLGGRKAFDAVPQRPHQPHESQAEGVVIVDNRDQSVGGQATVFRLKSAKAPGYGGL
jgi:hypothetical protein